MITGATRLACVLGHPAAHSLSPAIHNAAFAASGLDWIYAAFDVAPARLPQALDGVRALGIAGANLTMPHKQAVLPLLDAVDDDAGRIGAVNTIVNRDGSLCGVNTDGAGFLRFLEAAGIDPAGRRALVLGAGGASRAIAWALGAAGARVVVAARDAAAATEVAALAGGAGRACAWDDRDAETPAAALVVNATPLGAGAEPAPVDVAGLDGGACVVDLIYVPVATELVRAARARSLAAHNGLGLLLHQAALSFEAWTGLPAPEAAMAAAVRDAANAPF